MLRAAEQTCRGELAVVDRVRALSTGLLAGDGLEVGEGGAGLSISGVQADPRGRVRAVPGCGQPG